MNILDDGNSFFYEEDNYEKYFFREEEDLEAPYYYEIEPSDTFIFPNLNIKPIQIGQKIPDLQIECYSPDLDHKTINLNDFKGKFLIIISYPFNCTSISSSEIISFNQNYLRFQEIGAEIIAISSENVYSLNYWANLSKIEGGFGGCNFLLGSDLTGNISRVLGFYLENESYPSRSTIIIDPDGEVKHMSSNMSYQARSVEEILRLLKAFVFNRKNGNVCPAQWQEGHDSISPEINKSKDYFQNKYK